MENEVEIICKTLNSVLILGKRLTVAEIEKTYKELTYRKIEYHKYGCNDLPEFFNKFMNNEVMVSRKAGLILYSVESHSQVEHMADLIHRTKSKYNSQRGRGDGDGIKLIDLLGNQNSSKSRSIGKGDYTGYSYENGNQSKENQFKNFPMNTVNKGRLDTNLAGRALKTSLHGSNDTTIHSTKGSNESQNNMPLVISFHNKEGTSVTSRVVTSANQNSNINKSGEDMEKNVNEMSKMDSRKPQLSSNPSKAPLLRSQSSYDPTILSKYLNPSMPSSKLKMPLPYDATLAKEESLTEHQQMQQLFQQRNAQQYNVTAKSLDNINQEALKQSTFAQQPSNDYQIPAKLIQELLTKNQFNTTPTNPQFNTQPTNPQFNNPPTNPQFNTQPTNPQFNNPPTNPQFNTTSPNPQYNVPPPSLQFNTMPTNSQFNTTPPNSQFNAMSLNSQFNTLPPNQQLSTTPNQQFNTTPPNIKMPPPGYNQQTYLENIVQQNHQQKPLLTSSECQQLLIQFFQNQQCQEVLQQLSEKQQHQNPSLTNYLQQLAKQQEQIANQLLQTFRNNQVAPSNFQKLFEQQQNTSMNMMENSQGINSLISPISNLLSPNTPPSIIPPITSAQNLSSHKFLSSQNTPSLVNSSYNINNLQANTSPHGNAPVFQQNLTQNHLSNPPMSLNNDPLVTIDHFQNPYANEVKSKDAVKESKLPSNTDFTDSNKISHKTDPINNNTNAVKAYNQFTNTNNTQMQNKPNIHMENKPNIHMENKPNIQMQNKPNTQMEHKPNTRIENNLSSQIKNIPNNQIKSNLNNEMENKDNVNVTEHASSPANDAKMPHLEVNAIDLDALEEVWIHKVVSVEVIEAENENYGLFTFFMVGLSDLNIDNDYLSVYLTSKEFYADFSKERDGVVGGVLYSRQGDKMLNVNKFMISEALSMSVVPIKQGGGTRVKYSRSELFTIRKHHVDEEVKLHVTEEDVLKDVVREKTKEEKMRPKVSMKMASVASVTDQALIWLDFKTIDLTHLKELTSARSDPARIITPQTTTKKPTKKQSVQILKEGSMTRLLCCLQGLHDAIWPTEAVEMLKEWLKEGMEVVVQMHGRGLFDSCSVVLVDLRPLEGWVYLTEQLLQSQHGFLLNVASVGELDDGAEVLVTYIKTRSHFFVIPFEYFEKFSMMSKTMQSFYNDKELEEGIEMWLGGEKVRRAGEVDLDVNEVEEGSLYAVLYNEDSCWYRGKIISKKCDDYSEEQGQFLVHFVDVGHQEWLSASSSRSNFKLLINEFRHLPMLSHEFMLAGNIRCTHTEKELKKMLLFKRFKSYPVTSSDKSCVVLLDSSPSEDSHCLVHYR